jgi:hypothetical protein
MELKWAKLLPIPKISIKKSKEQLAYYSKTMGLREGVYLVFVPNTVKVSTVQEKVETINGITIRTYIVQYDEEKDF